mmetsp:Transcript_109119/g.250288  ORF Transcript_109119/g.250288 Transcript_109119/m.250288 type:complete len:200 (+) Transcript_109119:1843-2442(+)
MLKHRQRTGPQASRLTKAKTLSPVSSPASGPSLTRQLPGAAQFPGCRTVRVGAGADASRALYPCVWRTHWKMGAMRTVALLELLFAGTCKAAGGSHVRRRLSHLAGPLQWVWIYSLKCIRRSNQRSRQVLRRRPHPQTHRHRVLSGAALLPCCTPRVAVGFAHAARGALHHPGRSLSMPGCNVTEVVKRVSRRLRRSPL